MGRKYDPHATRHTPDTPIESNCGPELTLKRQSVTVFGHLLTAENKPEVHWSKQHPTYTAFYEIPRIFASI